MDFGVALIAMQNGRKTYRTGWKNPYTLEIGNVSDTETFLINKEKTSECWTPKHKDLLMDDWEVL